MSAASAAVVASIAELAIIIEANNSFMRISDPLREVRRVNAAQSIRQI
jgi:hypothetical protein